MMTLQIDHFVVTFFYDKGKMQKDINDNHITLNCYIQPDIYSKAVFKWKSLFVISWPVLSVYLANGSKIYVNLSRLCLCG